MRIKDIGGWTKTEDGLPETEGFVSEPVLFVDEGVIYAGQYHCNGWFYGDIHGHEFMVKGARKAIKSQVASNDRMATHWRYLNPEKE